jgi:hypothetical protein
MAKHLLRCPGYLESRPRTISFRQSTLEAISTALIARMPEERFKRLQKKATYVIYCEAKPFSLWEEEEMKELLKDLEPAWKAPSARVCGGRLLDECYEEVWKEVLAVIKTNPKGINVSTNESATATKERVVNFSILCELGSFCIKQDAVRTGAFGAEKQAD